MKYSQEKRQAQLKKFLFSHQNHLSNEIKQHCDQQHSSYDLTQIKATIISDCDEEDLKLAAQRLRSGQLVAFPTQTVYGLGANALDEKALVTIYQTKKRPLSDPIIVHISQPEQAYKYVDINEQQKKIFDILTQYFWPGPMTIILKANLNVLPMVVTAQTGFVGIRCPNHKYFKKLLQQSKIPIGAPSANLFSHVSPTESVHVFNDFYKDDVWIVEGGKCQFGIESTVLKILDNEIKIFREGSLSTFKLKEVLDRQLGQSSPKIQIIKKTINHKQNSEAPGQLLKHYSPHLPCKYVQDVEQLSKLNEVQLKQLGIISFDEAYSKFSKKVGAYFQVGMTLNVPQTVQSIENQKFCTYEQRKKMREIYFLLREAQNLPLNTIVIGWNGDKQGTIWDKVFRATQGKQFLS